MCSLAGVGAQVGYRKEKTTRTCEGHQPTANRNEGGRDSDSIEFGVRNIFPFAHSHCQPWQPWLGLVMFFVTACIVHLSMLSMRHQAQREEAFKEYVKENHFYEWTMNAP